MGIQSLKDSGWFNESPKREIDLSLTEDQINTLLDGGHAIAQHEEGPYLVYLRDNVPLKELEVDDLIIRKIP